MTNISLKINYLNNLLFLIHEKSILKEWWDTMCESLTNPATVRTQVQSPKATQYSPLLNDDQGMSNSTIKN